MKNFMKMVLVITLFMFVGISISFAGIKNSKHDFSNKTWNSNEICAVCHTPHNADVNVLDAPLWNHEVTSAIFVLYDSSTMDATTGNPTGSSKLCLSCHDGTIAIDSFGGATGTILMTGGDLIGNDLSNDHPISFTYDTILANNDGGLFDPAIVLSGLGSTIDDDLLSSGQLQCSSCHDVHNKANINSLLVKSNAGSDLCLTCHDK